MPMPRARWNNSPTQSYLPADMFDVVAPSDSAFLPWLTREIHIPADGNLAVVRPDGVSKTIPVLAGQVIPIQVGKILATGTSGITSLLVLF